MLKIKEILSCIVLAFLLIAMISIPEKKKIQNKQISFSLPKNTVQHCFIDPLPIIKNSLFDELFIVKDAQVVKEVIDLLKKSKSNKKTKFTTIGIDFFSSLELIEMNYENQNIILFRSNLESKEKFKKTSQKLGLKTFLINNQGYIILKGDINTHNLRSNIENNEFKYSTSRLNDDIILSQFKDNILIQERKFFLTSNKITAIIKGIKENIQVRKSLKPSGIHSSFSLQKLVLGIPSDYLKNLDFLKKIQYVSLNYAGFELEDEGEILGVPKFDVLLTFKNQQNAEDFINKIQSKYNLPILKNDNGYSIGSKKIFIQQVSDKIIYLSTQKTQALFTNSYEPFQFEGDLKMLTKIENSGWSSLVLDLIPGYQASKNLFESTDYLSMKRIDKQTSKIDLKFKKDENVYHSFLKLFLLLSVE
jgi:hypothetical protein